MSDAQLYTEDELVQISKERFGACLIISCASFMLFGYNISQAVQYISTYWRRDKALTKTWVILVMLLNTASVLYGGVYADWVLSISSWSSSFADHNNVANGVSSILYGLTLTSVQLFWVACIHRMMASRPTLRLFCCGLIILVLSASLSIGIAIGSILIEATSEGISAAHSRLNRAADGLTLLADVIILIVIFANMLAIKKSSKTLKRSISRLTFIFAIVTCLSSLLLVVEIVLIYPSSTQSRYIIDFTYFYTPVYTFAMFAILNARISLFTGRQSLASKDKDIENLAPQMHFTVDNEASTAYGSEKDVQIVEVKSFERRTEPGRLHMTTMHELGRESEGGVETCP